MSTFTREQLRARAREKVKSLEFSITQTAFADSRAELEEELELARIALASLEAEPVAWLLSGGGAKNNVSFDSGNAYADPLREVTPLYTAHPAPVSVPAAMEMDDDFDSAFEHGKAVGWNAYRAAMLQGADRPQNEPQNIPENIPATQFKPVADLYGLTSPTGGETSFTFDAVEARDFIDGGWLCQEYVELGRFQEVMLQNGNSPAQDGNYPVVPDGWVACSERMPEQFKAILAFNEYGEVWSGAYDRYWNFYCDNLLVEHVTHWMPLPAAPQQEA
ncbi:DUF551 domain-containing protein [Enterobacter cloacae]|uniref:DUF551 domain-containing protein n=1 Tax=Enterobacter cloacae TaxID=550 RepID=UPI002004C126|nr:DUF551 domain-containing protein [Enterobacter cloacae]MCK7382420.1 DUF551 domain-containing protein [Enterobacter cloacae]